MVGELPSYNDVRVALCRHRAVRCLPVPGPLCLPDEFRTTLGAEADLGIFNMFGRTGAPTKMGLTGQRLSDASFRMQKAVSPLSIQITAAILRTVHMYQPNIFVN